METGVGDLEIGSCPYVGSKKLMQKEKFYRFQIQLMQEKKKTFLQREDLRH